MEADTRMASFPSQRSVETAPEANSSASGGVVMNPATDARALSAAVDALRRGGLVAFPTETVYGLGADAENLEALERLYAVKGRPRNHPVIVHLASASQLTDWAREIPDVAWQLAEAFWPGPLTLILPRSNRVPDAVTGGQDTVGLRVPNHPVTLALLQAFGGGVAGPSANRFGRLSPTAAAHVAADLGADVEVILEGGDCWVGVESTIVAFRDGQPVVLRPGHITPEQIAEALRAVESMPAGAESLQPCMDDSGYTGGAQTSESCVVARDENQDAAMANTVSRAPGTLASHYAPRAPLDVLLWEDLLQAVSAMLAEGKTLGVLAGHACPSALCGESGLHWIQAEMQPEGYTRHLYARLRSLDALGVDRILVEAISTAGAWAAVSDRLRRAAYREV